jgi:hypothetical protein
VLLALESDPDWKKGQYGHEPALHLMNMVQSLALQTPAIVATNTTRQDYSKFESDWSQGPDDLDANDTLRQIQALLSTGVAAFFNSSLQRAAAAVHVAWVTVLDFFMAKPQKAALF